MKEQLEKNKDITANSKQIELLKQHLIEDDKELDRIYKKYKAGKMSSGEIKDLA